MITEIDFAAAIALNNQIIPLREIIKNIHSGAVAVSVQDQRCAENCDYPAGYLEMIDVYAMSAVHDMEAILLNIMQTDLEKLETEFKKYVSTEKRS